MKHTLITFFRAALKTYANIYYAVVTYILILNFLSLFFLLIIQKVQKFNDGIWKVRICFLGEICLNAAWVHDLVE